MRTWMMLGLLLFLIVSTVFALDPVTDNLVIQAGEDWTYTVLSVDGTNRPVDLTGYRYQVQFRSEYQSPAVLAEALVDLSQVGNGMVTYAIPSATTARLAGTIGVWDLRETAPDGTVSYLQRGRFRVDRTVTR